MTTADQDVEDFLNNCIHRPCPSTDFSSLGEIELCPKDGCSQSVHGRALTRLVQGFNDCLAHYKICAGALITFGSGFTHDSTTCFLGVKLQRPMTQTLMHVEFNDAEEISFILDTNNTPKISTSKQMFSSFIKAYTESVIGAQDPTCEKISFTVDVWSHSVKWLDGHRLVSQAESLLHSLQLDTHRKRLKKKPGRLPFGLKLPRKNRLKAATKKKASQKPKQKKRKATLGSESPLSISSSAESHQKDRDQKIGETPEFASSNDLNAECDPIDPVSDTMIAEEIVAKSLETEKEKEDMLRSELQQKCLQGKGKSFFLKSSALTVHPLHQPAEPFVCTARAKLQKARLDVDGTTHAFDQMHGCMGTAWFKCLTSQDCMNRAFKSLPH